MPARVRGGEDDTQLAGVGCTIDVPPIFDTVSRRAKCIGLLVAGQVTCVAVGLWTQQQYMQSCAQREARAEARAELDRIVDRLLAELDGWTLESSGLDSPEIRNAEDRLQGREATNVTVMIVDRNWRTMAQLTGASSGATTRPTSQRILSWMRSDEPPADTPGILRGTLTVENDTHIASAGVLSGKRGYIVAHRSIASIAAMSTPFVQSLPALGAITFLWTCGLLSTVTYLISTRFHEQIEREQQKTNSESLRRAQNLVRTRDAVIFGLAKLADSRDPETGDHLERISIYSATLASALQRHSKFSKQVTPAFVRLIGTSSALHDIGKVGIEDAILRKPTDLTPTERTRMQTHTTIGADCLREIEYRLGSSNFLQMATRIALAHHERWDGTGYPKGLAGEAIPLAARIVGIVDVYDALASRRVYKCPLAHEECVAIIQSQAGKHFDPDIVDVWLTVEPKFREIAAQYSTELDDEPPGGAGSEPDEPLPAHQHENLVDVVAAGQFDG